MTAGRATKALRIVACHSCVFLSCGAARYCVLADLLGEDTKVELEGDPPPTCQLITRHVTVALELSVRRRIAE